MQDQLKFPNHHHDFDNECKYCIKHDGQVRVFDNEYLLGGKYGYSDIKQFTKDNIREQLSKNHNIINHSAVCYSRTFWDSSDNCGNMIRYRNEKPYEDLLLWKILSKTESSKIGIVPEVLIYYRIHENQIGSEVPSPFPKEFGTRIGFLLGSNFLLVFVTIHWLFSSNSNSNSILSCNLLLVP